MPLYRRNGKLEFEAGLATIVSCPYCARIFPPPKPATPVNEIGQDYRDHLARTHPVQDHDLKTTRWHNGEFIRCAPRQPSGGRVLRTRSQPRTGHGAEMVRLGDSDDGINVLMCRCGWFSIDSDPSMAWHDMRVHWRNDYRLTCPQCGWYWEDQDREDAERQMALHIGIEHPASFPWGYQAP